MKHQPVLLQEVIKYLDPKPNQNFIDATVGDGGHANEILRHISPSGQVLGIDWDETAIKNLKRVESNGVKGVEKGERGRGEEERGEKRGEKNGFIVGSGLDTGSNAWEAEPPRTYSRSGIEPRSYPSARSGQVIGDLESRLVLKQGNFAQIKELWKFHFHNSVDGVLFDLGLRSGEIEDASRGFSFMKNGPLDMRYHRSQINADQTRIYADPLRQSCLLRRSSFGYEGRASEASQTLTAAEIVNTWSEEELARIFKNLGEEKNYKKIARAIAAAREKNKITTTGELAAVIKEVVASNAIKTNARIFQALRMAVNSELENLEVGLEGAWDVVSPRGRIAVISFHSLEDRMVKNFFKEKQAAGAGEILTKKPVRPSAEEIRANPRSRSAKLRVIQKIESRE